jgi:hypothetical protein
MRTFPRAAEGYTIIATRLSAVRTGARSTEKRGNVGLILLVLLLALLLGGLGFAAHLLWVIAVIVFVFWLVGFAFGRGRAEGARGWYRW